MKTEEILKQIYQDLKEEITKNSNNIFIKAYTIPSINYNSNNKDREDMYFASGIQMELERMIEQFENKVYYSSYKDRYFFSNNEQKAREIMLIESNKDITKDYKKEMREKHKESR